MSELTMDKCRKRLAILWFVGSGVLFFIIFLQIIIGHYQDHSIEAWRWFLPTVLPTLSLMVAVFVKYGSREVTKAKTVDKFRFRLTFFLSAFYLVAVSLIILIQPFVASTPAEYITLMNQSNLGLGPFQGLVSMMIGIFFIKTDKS